MKFINFFNRLFFSKERIDGFVGLMAIFVLSLSAFITIAGVVTFLVNSYSHINRIKHGYETLDIMQDLASVVMRGYEHGNTTTSTTSANPPTSTTSTQHNRWITTQGIKTTEDTSASSIKLSFDDPFDGCTEHKNTKYCAQFYSVTTTSTSTTTASYLPNSSDVLVSTTSVSSVNKSSSLFAYVDDLKGFYNDMFKPNAVGIGEDPFYDNSVFYSLSQTATAQSCTVKADCNPPDGGIKQCINNTCQCPDNHPACGSGCCDPNSVCANPATGGCEVVSFTVPVSVIGDDFCSNNSDHPKCISCDDEDDARCVDIVICADKISTVPTNTNPNTPCDKGYYYRQRVMLDSNTYVTCATAGDVEYHSPSDPNVCQLTSPAKLKAAAGEKVTCLTKTTIPDGDQVLAEDFCFTKTECSGSTCGNCEKVIATNTDAQTGETTVECEVKTCSEVDPPRSNSWIDAKDVDRITFQNVQKEDCYESLGNKCEDGCGTISCYKKKTTAPSTCPKCLKDSYCTDPSLPACSEYGKCEECTKKSHCSSRAGRPHCNTQSNACKQCLITDHCADNEICDGFVCTPKCSTDVDCASNPIKRACASDGRCVQCTDNNDCAANIEGHYKCDPSDNSCKECFNNTHCPSNKRECDMNWGLCRQCYPAGQQNAPHCTGYSGKPHCDLSYLCGA